MTDTLNSFIVGFGLFMGYVDNKKKLNSKHVL